MRVKATVAYDGTGYAGFQRQSNALTIQEELERALTKLCGTFVRVLASGRTDAGVHAVGQVIAFDTEWRHPLGDLHRGMNALLPEQIAVQSLSLAADDFHPRYDAVRRSYRYTLYRAAVRHPLHARFSLYTQRDLDIAAMQAAAATLLGQQDFVAFGSPPSGKSTVREVYSAAWMPKGSWLFFDIQANAFLYRMVRMLVGTLLRVGYGALTPEDFEDILRTCDRQRAGPAVAAHGLCLQAVAY